MYILFVAVTTVRSKHNVVSDEEFDNQQIAVLEDAASDGWVVRDTLNEIQVKQS